MQFVFHQRAGEQEVVLEGESFVHIFGARRTRADTTLLLRNLYDDMLYCYKITHITRKSAHLMLVSSTNSLRKSSRFSHIIWAITQPQTIQKALPVFNELGLSRLSLFWSDFSQRTLKLDLERLKRILIASCEQCGRSDLCQIEILENLPSVLKSYPKAWILDFGAEVLGEAHITTGLGLENGVVIGAEGGFSPKERKAFAHHKIFSLDSPFVLRSQTAATAVLALFSIAAFG